MTSQLQEDGTPKHMVQLQQLRVEDTYVLRSQPLIFSANTLSALSTMHIHSVKHFAANRHNIYFRFATQLASIIISLDITVARNSQLQQHGHHE